MKPCIDSLKERAELARCLISFKSMVWVRYLLRHKKCSSVYELNNLLRASEPSFEHILRSQKISGLLYRKQKGEPIRVRRVIESYDAMVPGSANILEHPIFGILNGLKLNYWCNDEEQLKVAIASLPNKQRNLVLKLNQRLTCRLKSPLKRIILERLGDAEEIDALTALLIIYAICQRQYVRPSFFWALEKTMFRVVIRMFCLHYHPKIAFQVVRAIQFALDDIDAHDSKIKFEIQFSRRKRRFNHIFFHRISNEKHLQKLISKARTLYLP